MSYQYRGPADHAQDDEARTLAKFEFYRRAEANINAGPARIEYHPAPIQERKAAPECGTHSGYKAHIVNKTTPCQECRRARAAYQRHYRATRKAAA